MLDLRKRCLDLGLYAIIFIAFYLLNRFSPFICDDYYYAFIMQDGMFGDMTYTPIKTIPDVLRSQVWAYFHHNGRFLVHSIVQLFCGILGMQCFAVINSIIFICLLIGFTKCVRIYRGVHKADVILNLLALFLFIPIIGVTYLGNISFAVNYLWTSCAVIWWLYMYLSCKDTSFISNILLGVFSVLVGSMQESFSIGITGALLIFYSFNLRKLTGTRLYLVVGFILGSCIVVLAPANFARFMAEQGSSIKPLEMCLKIVRVGLSLRAFWMVVLFWIVMCFYKSRSEVVDFVKSHMIEVLACFINIMFASLIAMNGKHQMVCVELFSVLILLVIIRDTPLFWKINRNGFVICLVLIGVLAYGPIYNVRKGFYSAHQELLKAAAESVDGIVVAKEYEELCCKETSWLIERFAKQEGYWSYNKRGLSLLLSEGRNISHINSILPATPNEIVAMCTVCNMVDNCVYKEDMKDYYVLCIEEDKIDSVNVEICLRPGFLGRVIYEKLYRVPSAADTKTQSLIDANKLHLDEKVYVIVSDSSPIQRVKIIKS